MDSPSILETSGASPTSATEMEAVCSLVTLERFSDHIDGVKFEKLSYLFSIVGIGFLQRQTVTLQEKTLQSHVYEGHWSLAITFLSVKFYEACLNVVNFLAVIGRGHLYLVTFNEFADYRWSGEVIRHTRKNVKDKHIHMCGFGTFRVVKHLSCIPGRKIGRAETEIWVEQK